MNRRSRKAHSLVEILIISVPTLMILGICMYLLSRMTYQDSWNDQRMRSIEALLLSWENLRTDLAGQAGGVVEVTSDGLRIQRQIDRVAARKEETFYVHDAVNRKLSRNGHVIGTTPVDEASFGWVEQYRGSRYNSLMQAGFASQSGSTSGPIKANRQRLEGLVHIPAKANAQRFSGWVTDVQR